MTSLGLNAAQNAKTSRKPLLGLASVALLALNELIDTANAKEGGTHGDGVYRFKITALARAAGLKTDQLSVAVAGNDQVSFDQATKELVYRQGDDSHRAFQITLSDGEKSVTETASLTIEAPSNGGDASNVALTVSIGGKMVETASTASENAASGLSSSSTLVTLIDQFTTPETGPTVAGLSAELDATLAASASDSAASISSTSDSTSDGSTSTSSEDITGEEFLALLDRASAALSTAATAAVAHVNNAPSGVPVLSSSNAVEDTPLTVDTSGIADADGLGTFSYQWQSLNGTWNDISGATASSFAPGSGQIGLQLRVEVSYTDGGGTVETLTSAATSTVAQIDHAPTGLPTLSDTTPTEDSALTVDTSTIVDADGIPVPPLFTIQWQSSTDGNTWANISGATSVSFTPGDAEVGLLLRAQVSYTDNRGYNDTVASAATAAVANINDAPVLDNSGTPSLTAIAEDVSDAANTGTLVSDLVGASISDVDSGALEGIAITSLDTSNGTWQYELASGGGWTDAPAVSATSALLLGADDSLRFVPDANYNGSASLAYQAWDQTSGTAGGTADASTNGGTTAFSTASETATITITPVNDAPVANADDNGSDTVIKASDESAVGNVLANDTDVDSGDTLTVVGVAAGTPGGAPSGFVGVSVTGTYGFLTLSANGDWTYQLNDLDPNTIALLPGDNVQDLFTYTVEDTGSLSDTATLTIDIQGGLII